MGRGKGKKSRQCPVRIGQTRLTWEIETSLDLLKMARLLTEDPHYQFPYDGHSHSPRRAPPIVFDMQDVFSYNREDTHSLWQMLTGEQGYSPGIQGSDVFYHTNEKYFQMCIMAGKVGHIRLMNHQKQMIDDYVAFPCIFPMPNETTSNANGANARSFGRNGDNSGETVYFIIERKSKQKRRNRQNSKSYQKWNFVSHCRRSEVGSFLAQRAKCTSWHTCDGGRYSVQLIGDWEADFVNCLPTRINDCVQKNFKATFPFVINGNGCLDSLLDKLLWGKGSESGVVSKHLDGIRQGMNNIGGTELKRRVKAAIVECIAEIESRLQSGMDVAHLFDDNLVTSHIRIMRQKFMKEFVCYCELRDGDNVYPIPFCIEEKDKCYYIAQLFSPWMIHTNVGLHHPARLLHSLVNLEEFRARHPTFWPFIIGRDQRYSLRDHVPVTVSAWTPMQMMIQSYLDNLGQFGVMMPTPAWLQAPMRGTIRTPVQAPLTGPTPMGTQMVTQGAMVTMPFVAQAPEWTNRASATTHETPSKNRSNRDSKARTATIRQGSLEESKEEKEYEHGNGNGDGNASWNNERTHFLSMMIKYYNQRKDTSLKEGTMAWVANVALIAVAFCVKRKYTQVNFRYAFKDLLRSLHGTAYVDTQENEEEVKQACLRMRHLNDWQEIRNFWNSFPGSVASGALATHDKWKVQQ